MPLTLKLIAKLLFILIFGIGAQLFRIWRFFVYILSKIIQLNELDEILEGDDNFFVLLNNPAYLNKPLCGISIILDLKCSEPFNLKKFQYEVERTLNVRKSTNFSLLRIFNQSLIYKRLRQYPKIWMGYTFFAWDKKFSVSKHVTISTAFLENPSLTIEEIVQHKFHMPFPQNTSPWEIIVFPESLIYPSITKVYIRIDHILGDGLSFLRALCDLTSIEIPQHRLMSTLTSSCNFISNARKLLTHLTTEIKNEKRLEQANTLTDVIKSENTAQSFLSSTKEFALEPIKNAKRSKNLSFAELLTNIVRNNLNTFFRSKNFNEDLIVPIIITLPDVLGLKSKGFRNRHHTVTSYLTLDETKSALSQLNNAFMEYESWIVQQANYFPNIIQKWLLGSRKHSICIGNILGPAQSVHLMSQLIVSIKYWMPIQNSIQMFIQFFTYNNKLKILCTGNSCLFENDEDFQNFVQNLETDLEKMAMLSTE